MVPCSLRHKLSDVFGKGSRPDLRFAQSPTSSSLTDLVIPLSTPRHQLNLTPSSLWDRHHVCSFARQLHRQAPFAEALDDAHCQLVHRRRRLQKTRIEVTIPLLRYLRTSARDTSSLGRIMGRIGSVATIHSPLVVSQSPLTRHFRYDPSSTDMALTD